jgi:uncharacterized surface protein with fasciclin (FAS1) repeats
VKRTLLVLAGSAAVAVPVVATTSAGASFAPPASAAQDEKNIVEIAAGDKRFTTLVRLVQKADLADTLSGGEFTVFAPTNAAFRKLPKRTLRRVSNDPDLLRAVLTYHAVAGTVKAADVVKLKRAKTVNGKNIRISVRGGNVFLNRSTKVTATDIEASNGVVHVINKVLIP